jgi:hypothetical protein
VLNDHCMSATHRKRKLGDDDHQVESAGSVSPQLCNTLKSQVIDDYFVMIVFDCQSFTFINLECRNCFFQLPVTKDCV